MRVAGMCKRASAAAGMFLSILALARPVLVIAADSGFDKDHTQALAANPPGVTLTLARDDSARPFRLGEPLPLKLLFRFTDPKAFGFDAKNYEPGWARQVDLFYAAPVDRVWRIESMYGGRVAGSPAPLGSGSAVRTIAAKLDDWLHFDRPGKYRVYCTSRRVWKAGTRWPQEPLAVTSNILDIEILPIPADKLAERMRQADKDFGPGVPKDRRNAAVDWLRRLDSNEAARLLAESYQGASFGTDDLDAAIGRALRESQHRQAIVAGLEQRLRRPDFGPKYYFLSALAELDSDRPSPSGTALELLDAAQRQRYAKTAADAHYDRQQILLAAYVEFMWRQLPGKSPTARAETAFTLFQLRSDGYLRSDARFGWTLAQLREMVQSDFLLLPGREQWLLLTAYWRRLGGPALATALAELIERAPERPAKSDDDERDCMIADTALERLLTANPVAAKRLIIAEIRRQRPRVITKTLLLLPDEPIPELDELLIGRLEKPPESDYESYRRTAALVNRYGSAALLGRVQQVVRRLTKEQVTGAYPALLAYWLKYEPKSGVEMVEKAMEQRDNNQHEDLLPEITESRLAPELLPICIRRLNDPDEMVVESATSVLGSFGTPEARQALKDRMRRWHDDLIAADPQAKAKIAAEGYGGPHRPFDSFVLQALRRSPLMVVTPEELRELEPLCMTKQATQEIEMHLISWTDPIRIDCHRGGEGEFEHAGFPMAGGGSEPGHVEDWWYVADYGALSKAELKAVMARFPRGTTFALPTYVSTDPAEFQRFFDELNTSVQQHGMKLVKVDR